MKTKLDYSLVDKTWFCEVFGFNVQSSFDDLEVNVNLTLKENGEIKVLRFSKSSQIEYENRYSNHGNNLEITNCEDSGMEIVNLKVSGFINGSGNFSFWAENMMEVFE